ncbi:MAG TPA: FAD-dependent oxidoreductase [Kofleriaceae bacterium]|nr:FAD-dependent oxidoreductase [Kofleriaceae bacterium]
MRVTVVGAGVAGLTTAIELEARGHDVTVVAEKRGDDITSSVAGAVWFPYRAGESPRVLEWAHRTRARLEKLAHDPDAGIDLLTFYECDESEQPPWWAGDVAVERVRAPVAGAPPAWRFRAPRAIPAMHLPWLEAHLRKPIERHKIDALDPIDADVIVVCAGLGARTLARDQGVHGLLGQVIIVEPGTIPLDVSFTDERGPAPIFYSIPRRDAVLLGGLSVPFEGDTPPAPDPAVTARILDQCRAFGWEPGAVIRERTGLRPVRAIPRVERDSIDPRVIHNYGHGGAGYTLAFACAEDVASLIGS